VFRKVVKSVVENKADWDKIRQDNPGYCTVGHCTVEHCMAANYMAVVVDRILDKVEEVH
jgi:hypothetical protein